MTTYTVPRVQGTYADTLMVLGLGRLLKVLSDQGKVRLYLDVSQDAYTLHVNQPITIPEGTPPRLYEYIKTDKDATEQTDVFDYVRERFENEKMRAWKENNKNTNWEDAPEEIHPPRADFTLYSSLVDLLKKPWTSGYAIAYHELASERFPIHTRVLIESLSGENPLSDIENALSKALNNSKAKIKVSKVQAFNPIAGKGMNSLKANSIGMGQEDGLLVTEALKYAGWFIGAVAVYPKANEKAKIDDLKILVVQPADIELETLRQVMVNFRKDFRGGGAVQVDILAALTLTETLLKHDEHKTFKRGRPRDLISGFQTAYFQNLGSAKGVTNISFIALPAWVRLDGDEADEQRKTWLDVLEEHRQVIRNLDESHSEERNLLERYRDFLSGQDVRAFLEFLSNYGPHVLRLADKGKYALWMTTDHLGRVLQNMESQKNNLNEIITNSGFQSVAGAIRRATRTALYTRKLSGNRTYEVHYGLAQELKRNAATKTRFMAALSDFVTEYMTENLRAADRGKRGRAPVTTEDLLEVGKLLDVHDSQMVAMLLIAYGYAKEPREETPEPLQPPEPADHSETDTTEAQA